MVVHGGLTLDILTIIFSPTKIYILPSIDNEIMFQFKNGDVFTE
jgi:hypothetical protein